MQHLLPTANMAKCVLWVVTSNRILLQCATLCVLHPRWRCSSLTNISRLLGGPDPAFSMCQGILHVSLTPPLPRLAMQQPTYFSHEKRHTVSGDCRGGLALAFPNPKLIDKKVKLSKVQGVLLKTVGIKLTVADWSQGGGWGANVEQVMLFLFQRPGSIFPFSPCKATKHFFWITSWGILALIGRLCPHGLCEMKTKTPPSRTCETSDRPKRTYLFEELFKWFCRGKTYWCQMSPKTSR